MRIKPGKHGASKTKLYYVWRAMKERCNNPVGQGVKTYYARDINVCQEWVNSFECFKLWAYEAGYKLGLFLDRKDNNLGYNPDNCRWVSATESSLHRRVETKLYTAFGDTKSLPEWARDPRCKLSYMGLRSRLLKNKYSFEFILTAEKSINGAILVEPGMA